MSASPYRMPLQPQLLRSAGSSQSSLPLRSLRERDGVGFIEMPSLQGHICHDMYGDLPFGLFTLADGLIRGDAGYIYSQGDPIFEQNADFLRKKKFLRPRLQEAYPSNEPPREVDELVPLTSRCDNCFWHWVMDSLPKVLVAEQSGFCGKYLIPPPSVAPFATQSMAMVGICPERLLYGNGKDVHVAKLYIPTYFCGYNAHHNIDFLILFRDWIRSAAKGAHTHQKKRIFVGRQTTSKARRLLNQQELEKTLGQLGFQTVYFENLSFHEQVLLACSAEIIVGGHGSGLCHALFMEKGSLLVELFPHKRQQTCDCYQTLCLIAPHRYRALESEQSRGGDIDVAGESVMRVLTEELA